MSGEALVFISREGKVGDFFGNFTLSKYEDQNMYKILHFVYKLYGLRYWQYHIAISQYTYNYIYNSL